MNVSVKGNEQITKLLNDWYQVMLQQQVSKAMKLKQEIESKMNHMDEDQKNIILLLFTRFSLSSIN